MNFTINSVVCEKHFRPEDIVLSSNGLKSLAPFAVPVTVMAISDHTAHLSCSIPGCITNDPNTMEIEDISLFSPRKVIFMIIHKYCFKIIIDVRSLLFLLLIFRKC